MARRFVQIGAGGVGGWLCVGLAHMLEFQDPGSALILIDGDHFEPTNLERQEFSTYGPKAEVRAAELAARFERTTIVGIAAWVMEDTTADTMNAEAPPADGDALRIGARALLEEGDVVFPVVDNFATRRTIFDAAHYFSDIDILSGGNDEGLFVSTYHYCRRGGIDVTDHPLIMHDDEYLTPADRNPGDLSCEERAALVGGEQTLVANMTVAALLLAKVHQQIFQGEAVEASSEQYWNLATMMGGNVHRGADDESRHRLNQFLEGKVQV